MALEFEVDSIDSFDDGVKSLYVAHEGKFRLDVSGIDPADELKKALEKERLVTRSYKEKAEGLSAAAQESERLKAESEHKSKLEKGEFKTLYESEKQARLDAEKASNDFRTSVEKKDIDFASLQMASKHATEASRAELLSEQISKYARYGKDGVFYEMGGIAVEAEEVTKQLTNKYPWLFDGSKATGGGATGGKSGGADSKTMSREDFDAMEQPDRSKFFASGGKLDD
jgi:hypothetical protein